MAIATTYAGMDTNGWMPQSGGANGSGYSITGNVSHTGTSANDVGLEPKVRPQPKVSGDSSHAFDGYQDWINSHGQEINTDSNQQPYENGQSSGSSVNDVYDPDGFGPNENSNTNMFFNELAEYFLDKQYNYNQASADKAMAFEAEQARLSREWQERMSNTSYQRAVEDLKKSGINPILAVQGLTGASTPSGAMASGSSASGSYYSGYTSNSEYSIKSDTWERLYKIAKLLFGLGIFE